MALGERDQSQRLCSAVAIRQLGRPILSERKSLKEIFKDVSADGQRY